MIFGKGIVRENELINIGLEDGFVKKKGSWLYYVKEDGEEISLGQGKTNAVTYLTEHPEIAEELERRIRIKHGLEEEIPEEG